MNEPKVLSELMEIYELRGIVPLRKEAIAHIKNLQRESLDSYWKNIHEKSAIPWIKEFFGISDEDL